jgi:hypothetical protein
MVLEMAATFRRSWVSGVAGKVQSSTTSRTPFFTFEDRVIGGNTWMRIYADAGDDRQSSGILKQAAGGWVLYKRGERRQIHVQTYINNPNFVQMTL